MYFCVNKTDSLKDINYVKYKKKRSIFFTDAAQFYWASKNTWLKNDKIISKNSKIIEIPFERSQDLNGELDLKILKLKKMQI